MSFANARDSDEDDDLDNDRALKFRLNRPPCLPGSTLQRKKHRYLAWTVDRSAIDADLKSYRAAVRIVERELTQLKANEADWLEAFNDCRSRLTKSINASRKMNTVLQKQMEVMIEASEMEMGNGKLSRKRKSSVLSRDVVGELEDRRENVVTGLGDYEKIIQDLYDSKGGDQLRAVPVHMTLDEADMKAAVAVPSSTKSLSSRASTAEQGTAESGMNTTAIHATNGLAPGNGSDTAFSGADHEGNGTMDVAEVKSAAVTGTTSAEMDTGDAEVDAGTNDNAAEDANSTKGLTMSSRVSARISNEEKTKAGAQDSDQIKDIPSFVAADKLKMAQASLTDMEPFFLPPTREDGEELPENDALTRRVRRMLIPKSAPDIQRTAATLVHPSNEAEWVARLERQCREGASAQEKSGPSGNTGKRKRRGGPSTIDIRTFVTPRTPRNVPLFVSPLSHYGDRYVGHLSGTATALPDTAGGWTTQHSRQLPVAIRIEEDQVIERCSVASTSIQATDTLKRTATQISDVNRALVDSEESLLKIQHVYATTMQEAVSEREQHREEMQSIRDGDKTAAEVLEAVVRAQVQVPTGFGVHAKKGIMKKKNSKVHNFHVGASNPAVAVVDQRPASDGSTSADGETSSSPPHANQDDAAVASEEMEIDSQPTSNSADADGNDDDKATSVSGDSEVAVEAANEPNAPERKRSRLPPVAAAKAVKSSRRRP